METELEVWKQHINRATQFAQGNASTQVQLAGIFLATSTIAFSLEKYDPFLILVFVIPIFSILHTCVASVYYSYVMTQLSYLEVYGDGFPLEAGLKLRSHERWRHELPKWRFTFFIKRLIRFYETPYLIFFLIYHLVPQATMFWGWYLAGDASPTDRFWWPVLHISLLILQFSAFGALSTNAFKAMDEGLQLRAVRRKVAVSG